MDNSYYIEMVNKTKRACDDLEYLGYDSLETLKNLVQIVQMIHSNKVYLDDALKSLKAGIAGQILKEFNIDVSEMDEDEFTERICNQRLTGREQTIHDVRDSLDKLHETVKKEQDKDKDNRK